MSESVIYFEKYKFLSVVIVFIKRELVAVALMSAKNKVVVKEIKSFFQCLQN